MVKAMKKRILAVLLAVLAMGLLLCACGDSKNDQLDEVAQALEGEWAMQSAVGYNYLTFSSVSGNAGSVEWKGVRKDGSVVSHSTGVFGVSLNEENTIEVMYMAHINEDGSIEKNEKPSTTKYKYTYEDGEVTVYSGDTAFFRIDE